MFKINNNLKTNNDLKFGFCHSICNKKVNHMSFISTDKEVICKKTKWDTMYNILIKCRIAIAEMQQSLYLSRQNAKLNNKIHEKL